MVTEARLAEPGEATIAALLEALGEEVSLYYEPRNEPDCWTVSLTRVPMIHDHFPSFVEGLRWLVDNQPRFDDWARQIAAGAPS